MKKLFAVALLSSVAATPAFAQDDDVTAAAFAGPRIELIAGADMLRSEEEDDQTELVYGVGAGFDFALGNMVAGVEGEYTRSTLDECETDVVSPDDELCVRFHDFAIGGRVGAVVGNQFLVYVKGAYTQLRPRVDYDGPLNDEVEELLDDEEFGHLDGIRAGVGVEGPVSSMGLVKIEYRYSNYEAGVSRHQLVAGLGLRF